VIVRHVIADPVGAAAQPSATDRRCRRPAHRFDWRVETDNHDTAPLNILEGHVVNLFNSRLGVPHVGQH
jgi:hypothetical protein